jgi:hypothetical protein
MSEADAAIAEDAFLGGRIRLRQPRRGHRAGTDAVLLAALAAPAAAEGWTGWSEFYRSFAVEPPPVRPVKLPGIHKVPDVTLKRGVIDTTPKPNVPPKPKSSLEAAPPAPAPARGWDPLAKKTITGAARPSPLDDLPAPHKAGSSPPTPAAIRRPVLDDRKYTGLVDDLVKSDRPPANGLAPKPNADLHGSGTPFSGKYRTASTTHKLR